MPDCSSINTRLTEARKAYHEIMTGQNITRHIDQNGEQVAFGRANSDSLLSYITRLENELAVCQGTLSPVRGPLRFTYGRRC